MAILSSNTFYTRHHSEVSSYLTSNNKSLYITGKVPTKNFSSFLNSDVLILDLKKNIDDQIMDISNYDQIIVTDIFELVSDIYKFLKIIEKKLKYDSTLIISTINNIWNPFLILFEFLNLKKKSMRRSYIPIKKINTVAKSSGFGLINYYTRQYFPFNLFRFGNLINKLLELVFFKFNFGIRTYLIFKKEASKETKHLTKSIIVPAKNEEGNLKELINRIPNLGNDNEIIISCGHSKDNTLEIAKLIVNENFDIKVIEQSGSGKANAVWEALDISNGEIIAILDADISVEPEALSDFFEVIEKDRGDFVNGTRLIYKMEKGAMRFINIVGNRVFQKFISTLIKQPITDSLCGTKVFKKELILDIKKWQQKIKAVDPFGDYDLLFSAASSGKKILELPVHYKSRKYGKTQISRFRDGFKLIKYLTYSFIIFNSSK